MACCVWPWLSALGVSGEEYFTVAKPGFAWSASARTAPGLWLEARDCLLSGRGEMLVKLSRRSPSSRQAVRSEIDQGARLRWLAENVWFPCGFIGDAIQWYRSMVTLPG